MHSKVYRLVCLILILFLGGCAIEQAGEQISDTRLLMDTYCTITIHGNVDQKLLDEAFELCAQLEELFSITVEGSDIWRINHAGGKPVTVDPRTVELISTGLEYGKLSGGMLDITIGRLSRLWNFGNMEQRDGSSAALQQENRPPATLLQSVDYTKVNIDGNTVWLDNPDTWIDLGAIAKGYIADKVAKMLIERGVTGALIDLGGDVASVGNRQNGDPWRIALQKPFGSRDEWIGIVKASDNAVVSSGTYERQYEINGVIYHHILDPTTGMPVETDIVSATVIASDALTGEGLSTIAILLGSAKAAVLFEQTPGFIGAVLVLEDGEILIFGDIKLET